MIIDIVKIALPATFAFFIGIALTPLLTHYLYKHKMWKKKAGKTDMDGNDTPIRNALHKSKDVGTPRMGGIVIWASSLITITSIWVVAKLFPTETMTKIDFLSRDQTWIPLFTLIMGSLIGLIDDFFEIVGSKSYVAGGLSLRKRLCIVGGIALFVALWFSFKLDVSTIGMPILGDINIGFFFIPFFIFVTLSLYASGVIDGIDGLSGGVFATIFSAYAVIAFYQDQINLAAFCAMLVGALLAFLWFNIPPARFYMTETGTMGLTITLAVVAFMTDSLGGGIGIFVLPIIAFPLVVTVLSDVIQITSKRLRKGKKVFLVAPLHHHFEALGWPRYKVTMRYWIISIIFATIGIIVALIN